MYTPFVCIALLALLVFGLGFWVSMQRGKTRTIYGYTEDPADPLYKAIRAHNNTVEFAPMLALLIYLLTITPQAAWVSWVMVIATVCRYLTAIGLIVPKSMDKPNPMRAVGALGTYLSGFALSVALLLTAFN